ncbi:MAG: diguanylate cyclase, partial [Steroidobacteraceae bacterium]
LLQGASLEAALRVGERLRKAVENMLMAHAGAPWGFVSISIGAASIVPASHLTPQELTERADAALYEAKNGGRDLVRVAEESFRAASTGVRRALRPG